MNWLSYASDVTCQPLGHSKCDKVPMRHGQLATTSRWGKVPIFKQKAPSFHASEFSYINFFLQKTDQILGFWACRGLKLRRNTCFCWFKSSFAVNFHVPKPERLALSIIWTSIFCLQKMPIWKRLLANQLGGLECDFTCLKRFFRKVPRKLRWLFFLN